MLKFIKNFFQKKELWIFASYVGIDEQGGPMFGYLCWPYHTINKYNDLTTNIMAYGEFLGHSDPNREFSELILVSAMRGYHWHYCFCDNVFQSQSRR